MTLSHSLRETQRTERAWLGWPALLTRTSTRPKRSSVHATNAAAASGSSRSTARAAHLPPPFSIVFTTASSGACRRPQITTWAPSAASMPAVTSPMPVPAPVTIATCPSSVPIRSLQSPCRVNALHSFLGLVAATGSGERLPFFTQARLSAAAALRLALPPGPHRLLEMVHARGAAVQHDLAELVEHRGGRRVDQRAQQRHLDHRPLALRDRDQDRHLGPVQVVERHPVHARHLVGVERGLRRALAPHDDRRDDEARARRIVVEPPQHHVAVERHAELLVQLAQRGGLRTLPGLEPAAGQRPLPRVRAQ